MIIFNSIFDVALLVIVVASLSALIILDIYRSISHYRIIKKENLSDGKIYFYPQRRIFFFWRGFSMPWDYNITFTNLCFDSYKDAKDFISEYVWKTFENKIL